jgi:hypothetical protein
MVEETTQTSHYESCVAAKYTPVCMRLIDYNIPKVSQKALKLTMGWHDGNMQHVWIGDQLHIHSLHNLLHEREREALN